MYPSTNTRRNPFLLSSKPFLMPKIIEAVYENGVFKPLEKVDLKEGEKVRLRVEKNLYDVILRYREYFEDVDEDLTTELVRERR